jgi:integrase
MPVNVYKRQTKTKGPQWEVIVSIGGRTVRQQWSLGRFRTRRLAEDCHSWAEELIAKGAQPPKELREGTAAGHSRSVKSASEQWIETRVDLGDGTRRRYASIIQSHGQRGLWKQSANRVTHDTVQRYINERIDEGASPGTIRLELGVVRGALDYVGIEPNPVSDRRVKRPPVGYSVDDPPAESEVRAIIRNIAPKHRLALALAEATGLRVSEICALRWSNIEWSDAHLRIQQSKTRSGKRVVPIPGELLEYLKAHRPSDDEGFVTREVRVRSDAHPAVLKKEVADAADRVNSAMAKACERAGLRRIGPHKLRHRYVSRRIVALNEDPVTVQHAAGHARASMTLDTYSHLRADSGEAWRELLVLEALDSRVVTSNSDSTASASARAT